jgi:hypothetical protein
MDKVRLLGNFPRIFMTIEDFPEGRRCCHIADKYEIVYHEIAEHGFTKSDHIYGYLAPPGANFSRR